MSEAGQSHADDWRSFKVLAGPLLRRVEPSRACVWVATTVPVTVRGTVLAALPPVIQGKAPPIVLGKAEQHSVKLGRNLHITLVEIRPWIPPGVQSTLPAEYPDRTLLSYDLEFIPGTEPRRAGRKLMDLPGLGGPEGIAYLPYQLPTFFLKRSGTLNVLHGSCRKLHGDGQDALAAGDTIIATTMHEATRRPDLLYERRPSALFLTGDQIYADDVAEPLIDRITLLGRHLLGWDERIPDHIRGTAPPLTQLHCGARGRIVGHRATRNGKPMFSSDAARNHLLGFADFAAMYLLSWNKDNWEELQPRPDCQDLARDPYYHEYKNLQETQKALPFVRRLLANIPTYMIWDDHEITDDWNLTRSWNANVRGSPPGRRIVANAMAAYWAFQAWGNDPDSFDEAFLKPILDYFEGEGRGAEEYEKALWAPENQSRWTFVAPINPPAIFLNTRTMRRFDSDDGPSQLLDPEALTRLLTMAKTSRLSGGPLLIISGAPVLGIPLIDWGAEQYAGIAGAPATDLESWHANRRGLYDLLRAIHDKLEVRHCLFLSGDVHYAFAMRCKLTSAVTGASTVFTQFTSSALKNSPGSLALELARRVSPARSKLRIWGSSIEPHWYDVPPGRALAELLTVELRKSAVFLDEADAAFLNIRKPHQFTADIEFLGGDTQLVTKMLMSASNIGQLQFRKSGEATLHFHVVKDGEVEKTSLGD